MSPVPTSRVRLASITLLASLAGCSDPAPAVTDAAVADVGTPADVPAAVDMPVIQVDVPIVDDAPPAPTDAPRPPSDVPTSACGAISGEIATHVTAMATTGWSALNRSRGIMMYGCAGATRPQDCLAMVPLADDTTIGATRSAIAAAHLRVLYTSTTRSTFWTRSSADGRFVGRSTRIRDLSRNADVTATGAMYDPAFYPDNSGFMYQPGGRNCPMSSLTAGTPTTVAITGAGSPCASSSAGLYQHLAAALEGGDYWATSAGTAAWDDGGRAPTLQETRRNEPWTATASTSLTLMANTGSGFTTVSSRNVSTPFQGDAVISPSSRLIVTRFVDEAGEYQGYVLHGLTATRTGAAIMASTRELARYCIQGAKPGFSFDERYITYHHYIGAGPSADLDARELGFTGADDPAFAEYASRGAANVYLLDLQTGRQTRVTTMAPGQYALYPHFRSDGWMYFLVRTLGTPREHVIASDAAFLMP